MRNKTAPPRPNQRILLRSRLFNLLDKAENASGIWLSGPAGSGKTSLIASYLADRQIPAMWYRIDTDDNDISNFLYYLGLAARPFMKPESPDLPLLTPEYIPGLDSFITRYFDTLCSHLKSAAWLILDNFQAIADDSPMMQQLARIIAQISMDLKVVVVSRQDPPPLMARLRANQRLTHMEGHDLALSADECQQLAKKLHLSWSKKEGSECHRITRGWIAGVVLWSLYCKVNPGCRMVSTENIPGEIFDYFTAEVFDTCNVQMQQFLLKTAFLPYMTIETAIRLTAMDAAVVIETLLRENFFLEQRRMAPVSYQYHPLFRNYLLMRASREFSAASITDLWNHAAAIMAETGSPGEALRLYLQGSNFQSMTGLILSQAPLLLSQGRITTLRQWIDELPDTVIQENPWLMCWKGLCLQYMEPSTGQQLLIQAYERFSRSKERQGQVFTWSVLVEAFLMMRHLQGDLDRWIDEGLRLQTVLPADTAPDAAGRFSASFLLALSMHRPGHPEIFTLQGRCEHLMHHCTDPHTLSLLAGYLCMSYIWLGQMFRTKTLLKQMQMPAAQSTALSVADLNYFTVLSIFRAMAGEGDAAHRTIEKTLGISEKLGIHIYDFSVLAYGAYIGLSTGDSRLSKRYLDRMETLLSPHAVADTAQFHHISAEFALLMRDLPGAQFHMDNCIRLAKTSGMPLALALSLTLQARVYLVQKQPQKAMAVLDRIMTLDVPRHFGSIYFLNQLLRADCARIQHRKGKMTAHLKAAFADRAENGFMIPISIDRDRLAVLCAEAMNAGIETGIVKEFIERLKLTPPNAACMDDTWPWPIKIYVLGRLEIHLENHPIDLSGKIPKKTLELLKLLICTSGGHLSRDKIIDQLWPDTDGDRAVQNMKTALHRLRRLLDQSSSVLLKNNRLALNPVICWVDAWHFESMARLARSGSTPDREMEWPAKAIASYNGMFDGFSDGHALGIGYAHHLRDLWVNAVLSQGRLLIGRDQMQAAEDLFRTALALDDTIESLYQELIALLYDQNRFAEGMFVFNRCQTMLKGRGLTPTEATMDLYSKLQKIRAHGS